ncbi:MAG TPA: hypothetical protein VFV46_07910 [Lacibacter sp.]|nr:hypothetical protein [Lacibacter sp.]
MNQQRNIGFVIVFLLIVSCTATTRFPVSATVPAAEITAVKKKEKNQNYVVEIKARYLAEASRLQPPKNNYCVWIVTTDGITKNIGQLSVSNIKKTELKAVTPFEFKEVFITAEDRGDVTYPSGVEISRTSFKK